MLCYIRTDQHRFLALAFYYTSKSVSRLRIVEKESQSWERLCESVCKRTFILHREFKR